MKNLWRDIRIVLRSLGVRPGPTAVIVLSLGLGIAAVTMMFSIVDVLFLRPLPFADAQRLVRVRDARGGDEGHPTLAGSSERSYVTLRDSLDAGAPLLADVATQEEASFNLVGADQPERVQGARVTASLLPTLGVEPLLGRNLSAAEDRPGGARVALLGYNLWQRRFAGDPAVLGRVLHVDGVEHSVIGVLPPRFRFPYDAELWVPLQLDPAAPRPGDHYLFTVARLAPGVSFEQAAAGVHALGVRLAEEDPDTHGGWDLLLRPLRQELTQDVQRPLLYALFAAAAFLLLIACANVAGLLLARGLEAGHDLALHSALGASRWHLARRLLVQGLVLGAAGGAVGVGVSLLGLRPLVALSPLADLDAYLRNVGLDWRVVVFVVALSALVGVLFSLPSLWPSTRPDLQRLLKEDGRAGAGRAGRRTLGGLVVGEVGVAVVLLVGAGLMAHSVAGLLATDPGFDEGAMVATLSLAESDYPDDASRAAYLRRVLERVRALPAVTAAAVTTTHPLSVARIATLASFEGYPPAQADDVTIVNYRLVSPQFFAAMGIPVVAGRALDETDSADGLPTVVISRSLARLHWDEESALGKRVKLGRYDSERPWKTVVGVAGDVDDRGDFEYTWYLPMGQDSFPEPLATLVVRGDVEDPLALAAPVRREIQRVDAQQPVFDVASHHGLILQTYREERFGTLLLSLFAALGLLLALVGIYGLLSYAVVQRRLEISVRMALGARRGAVLAQVVGRGVGLAAVGLAAGLAGTLVLSRLTSRFLYQTNPTDPGILSIVAAVILAVAAAASLVPALRASHVEPASVLRAP